MVHSPDAGIGKVLPSQKEALLYDDIVWLERMREEYNEYLEVLLWYLDPETASRKPDKNVNHGEFQEFFKPLSLSYFNSDRVVDFELLLAKTLSKSEARNSLIASICDIENCSERIRKMMAELPDAILAKLLITGNLKNGEKDEPLFSSIPNLIFTRDLAVTIKENLLLSIPAENARKRETLLFSQIAKFELFKNFNGELSERFIKLQNPNSSTIEGGDLMMISKNHLLIGNSIRTGMDAILQLRDELFNRKLIDKLTVIGIPKMRDFMHIDVVFTHIKKDLWVLYKNLSTSKKDIEITQFSNDKLRGSGFFNMKVIDSLEKLCEKISVEEFGARKAEFVYCAGGISPFSEREQWTDGCNLLVLEEGVAIGYDRNEKTTEEFRKKGFQIIKSSEFIEEMESGKKLKEVIKGDAIVLIPSGELSRARGGSHCMSLPLEREEVHLKSN